MARALSIATECASRDVNTMNKKLNPLENKNLTDYLLLIRYFTTYILLLSVASNLYLKKTTIHGFKNL